MRLLKLYECVCGYMHETGRDKYIPYFGESIFTLIIKLMNQEALYTDGSDSEQTEHNRQRDIAVMQADPRYYDIIDNFKEILNLGCIDTFRTTGLIDLLCRGEIPERGYFSSTLIDL
ncbi:MAG: hypothetical protein HUJ65_08215 [Oscillospiraceae bacterium]|nr:hypothetical protein [Oscillospiraceae bacterium]